MADLAYVLLMIGSFAACALVLRALQSNSGRSAVSARGTGDR
ncbi:hypothetical protein [Rhodococcus sp. NPDC059234]